MDDIDCAVFNFQQGEVKANVSLRPHIGYQRQRRQVRRHEFARAGTTNISFNIRVCVGRTTKMVAANVVVGRKDSRFRCVILVSDHHR